MNKSAIVIAVGLLLAGCAEWEKNHPYGLLGDLGLYGPSKEEQARFQAARTEAAAMAGNEVGFIGVGDTPEYVRLQWGDPASIRRSIIGNAEAEWWTYVTGAYSSNYVHFVDGRVYSIHQ